MEPNAVRADAGLRPARHIDADKADNSLVAGTVVFTLDGALPVEYLNPGDKVITRDSGIAVLREVRRTRRSVALVSVRAGSLGNTRPDRDAIFPASQEILIRDWRAEALFGASQALVPAHRLEDGEFIRPLGMQDVELVSLIFDTPHILYADGLEVASAASQMALA